MDLPDIADRSDRPAPVRRIATFVGADSHDRLLAGAGVQVYSEGTSDFTKLRTRDLSSLNPLHMSRNYWRQSVRYNLNPFPCVINLVSDPDQNPKVLENLVRLFGFYRGQVVNDPAKVLLTAREIVADRLRGIPGLIVPAIARIKAGRTASLERTLERAGIAWPAIVREAGTHAGRISGLAHNPQQVAAMIRNRSDYFVTSFVNFRSPDLLFRKYRVFFIGKRHVFRHLLHGMHWNIHAKNRLGFRPGDPAMIAEEKHILEHGLPAKVNDVLEAVRETVGLDYFGIDFGIMPDGDVVLFETNATMNFFPFSDLPCFDYVRACLKPAQDAVNELLYPEG